MSANIIGRDYRFVFAGKHKAQAPPFGTAKILAISVAPQGLAPASPLAHELLLDFEDGEKPEWWLAGAVL